MHRQEVMNVRQSRLDAARERLVIRRAQEGVQPDQTMTVTLQARHLTFEEFDITAVPTIADDQHHRASTEDAASPVEVEGFKRFANTRAARPIMNQQTYLFQCQVKVTDLQRAGNACEARAENKCFHLLTECGFHAINKVQEEPRVPFHRTTDVGNNHKRARLHFGFTIGPAQDLALRAQAMAKRAAQIDHMTLPRTLPTRSAF